jgi:O-antigen ligase
MAPKIAFLLCTVFVLFLLRIDRKKTPEVSHFLWVPTAWMLVVASRPLASWFIDVPKIELEAGSPLDRLFLLTLLGMSAFVLAMNSLESAQARRIDWQSFVKRNAWLVLFLIYSLVSILWSEIPFISIKRWSRELIAVVMALMLLTQPSPRRAFESLTRRVIYILVPFSLLLIKYFSDYGRQYDRWSGGVMWVGVTLQKNGLGRLLMIAVFFLVWSLMRKKQGRDTNIVKYENYANVFLLILSIFLLKGPTLQAYSASAVGALAVGLAVYMFLLNTKRRRGIVPIVMPYTTMLAVGIVFGVVTVYVGGTTVRSITSSLGRDATLTGRTGIWADLLPEALKKPLVGHGFGGFWTTKARLMFDITEAHSGYLDMLLGLGFVGLALFSMFLISTCRKAQNELNKDFDWAVLVICYFFIAVVHNVAETSFNTFESHLTATLLFLAVALSASSSYVPTVSSTQLRTDQFNKDESKAS